jgi:hypothetical protein
MAFRPRFGRCSRGPPNDLAFADLAYADYRLMEFCRLAWPASATTPERIDLRAR